MSKVQDKIVKQTIGTRKLWMRQSHKLPEYRSEFPFYDEALPRVAKQIKGVDNYLKFIDIGANVGDTVSLVVDQTGTAEFLCVEGESDFLSLLKKNIPLVPQASITVSPHFCGATNTNDGDLRIQSNNGTASLVQADNHDSHAVSLRTLDSILHDEPQFINANLLKIDTDGFEIGILKGAHKFLKYARPVIFTEFTPALYQELGQSYTELIRILVNAGYKEALLYDNYGYPYQIVDLTNDKQINEAVADIDGSTIYYFDLLTFHPSKKQYKQLFLSELEAHSALVAKYAKSLYQTKSKLDSQLATMLDEKRALLDQLSSITQDLKESHKQATVLTQELQASQDQVVVLTQDLQSSQTQVGVLTQDLQSSQTQVGVLTQDLQRAQSDIERMQSTKIWKAAEKVRKNPLVQLLKPSQEIKQHVAIIQKKQAKHNKKSKRLFFVGHSYHKVTQSSSFFLDILKKQFEVITLFDESWNGGSPPSFGELSEKDLGVVFWQYIPQLEVLEGLRNNNVTFAPMYDASGGASDEYWLQYPNVKFINFSSTLHNKITSLGLRSTHLQYFPKPHPSTPTNNKTPRVFFWQRTDKITIHTVEKLLGKTKAQIHIHRAVDPGFTFEQPTKTQEKKFAITYSDWFKSKREMTNILQQCDIYIAPREYEGIGLSFLEAMAMGKVVIAADNPTMNEYIAHGETGLLYNINQPSELDLTKINSIRETLATQNKLNRQNWIGGSQLLLSTIQGFQ